MLILITCISITAYYNPTNITLNLLVTFGSLKITSISIGLYILSSNLRNDRTKKLWLFIFLILPIISIVLFWAYGSKPFKKQRIEDIKEKRMLLYQSNYDMQQQEKNFNLNELFYKIVKHNKNELNAPIFYNNSFELIEEPIDLLSQTIKLIKEAKKTIFMHYYIIHNGKWLNLLIYLLQQKIKEGVEILILYDSFGSFNKLPKKTIKILENNGIKISKFIIKSDYFFRRTTNFRTHRKYLIVDNYKVISGGSNIGDSYLNIDNKVGHWNDLNYKLSGDIAYNMACEFIYDWYYHSKYKNDDLITLLEKYNLKQKSENIKESTIYTSLIHSGPDQPTSILNNVLLLAIANAKKSITVVTPYLFPTEEIIDSLTTASKSGIDVKIIVPGRDDRWSFTKAMNSLSYENLLQNNIKIYEYSGFLHTKAILIDDHINLLGSYNLDNRALVINYESMLVLDSKDVNKSLNSLFSQYIINAKLIDLNEINKKQSIKLIIKKIFINIFQLLL